MAVVLIGTLDTKGRELGFAREILRGQGLETLLVDVGSLGPPAIGADIPRDEVFRRAGTTAEAAKARGDRGEAVAAAARGIAGLIKELDDAGRVDGVLAIGGSAGTVIGTAAMRALPFGRPKVMVSTLASGQVRPFVGGSDILMLYPVADLAGLNRPRADRLANAAHRDGRAWSRGRRANGVSSGEDDAAGRRGDDVRRDDPVRRRASRQILLEDRGYEVIVFHATGVGGQSMEGPDPRWSDRWRARPDDDRAGR